MNKFKNQTVVISNTENEPFLLPIDLSQYGEFEPDELEIRVCNDFIEISGKQEWRMKDGGADKRSFARRHVLPNHIDLKAIYCRLLDTKTVLISAPSLSFVSKLTNSNQLKVDYILGLDPKGQFLKRYNSTSPTNQAATRTNKDKANKATKSSSNKDVTNLLFGLIKNPSKENSNSKLFATEMGQRNVNFVNNLKSSGLKVTKNSNHKIHLNVDQLMKDKKDELNRLIQKETGNQTAKRSKRRRSRRKKASDKDQTANSANDKKADDQSRSDEKVESGESATDNKEKKTDSGKSSNKNESRPSRKKDTSTSSTGRKREDTNLTTKSEKSPTDQKRNEAIDSIEKKEPTKSTDNQKDETANLSEMKDEQPKESSKDESNDLNKDVWIDLEVEKSIESSDNGGSVKSQLSRESSKGSLSKGFTNYISSFLMGGGTSETDSKPVAISLTSCMKDSNADKCEKKEKHVMISDISHQ